MGKKMLIVSVSILLIVVVWMVFFHSTASGPGSQIMADRAQNVFDSLQAGDYQNAERDFSPRARAALTPQKLGQKWSEAMPKLGPLKRHTITRMDDKNVYITCVFEKHTLWGVVTFDRQKQISGLNLSDKHQTAGNLIINDISMDVESLVYELPDDEGRDDAVLSIGQVHDRFFSNLETIDATKLDDSTLKDKLRGDFVLYTTIGSRLFKAATQPLRIQIDGGTLRWNGVTAPVSGIRVILVGKNPYGDGHCLVYAAGSNRLLVGINSVFHGPRSYHIFQGDTLLKEGYYNEKFVASNP